MAEKMLVARRIAIVNTLKCTLNCKLCCNFMQKFKKPYDVPVENIKNDIDHIFELFDSIEWLQFVGGEVFINKGMAPIYDYILKYKEKFEKLILMTNATILPSSEEISILKKYGEKCKIMISDYGVYSYKINEFVELCKTEGIPYIVKCYHGNLQYYSGWIDNTKFTEFSGSDKELSKQFNTCPQINMQNMHCLNGKLHMCSNSCFMSELGVCKPDSRDFIDLNNEDISIDEKRNIIRDFYKLPGAACRICSFKNMDIAQRFTAAEQINRKD